MTKDDFIKQFRPALWDLALESFYQARYNASGNKPSTGLPGVNNSEMMLLQMRTATDLLGRMYDAMNHKEVKDAAADRKAK